MRILHTADWHLGRRIGSVSRVDEQRALLERLVERVRDLDPDVVVVAGDVFDVFTPGADAETLYYRTVQRLADGGERCVLVVAGNHDSSARLTAPGELLETAGVIVHGDPHDPDDVPEPREHAGFAVADAGPGWVEIDAGGERGLFHLLPFPSRARLPPHVDDDEASATEIVRQLGSEVPEAENRYLVGHLYVKSGHDVDQDTDDYLGQAYAVGADALEGYDAAFLGHLHQPFPDEHWRYAGAPMAFDFDDPDVDRGAWLYDDGFEFVDLGGGRPLRQRHPADVDQALAIAGEDADAWVRLMFEQGTVLTRQERERVREAFGERLVDIRFEQVDPDEPETPTGVDLGDLDPEAAFAEYVEDRTGEAPSEELLALFADVLDPETAKPREPDQATLEVGE